MTANPKTLPKRCAALFLAAVAGCLGGVAANSGDHSIIGITDAAWTTNETGTITAAAGTVDVPRTDCVGRNSKPNLLYLEPPTGGLEVSEYLITLSADEPVDTWQSGTTTEGYPLISDAEPVRVPASTTAVAWGFSGKWNHTWNGDITVQSVGPGGWTSTSVRYDWAIGFDWIGAGYGECSAP